jgi:hypothetical protein
MIILILFLINLIINFIHLLNFINSRFILNTSPIRSDAPRYDSINYTYCDEKEYIIPRIYICFIVFSILVIIFFGNTIVNKLRGFNNNKMINEIEIFGYDKYFNMSIKSETEYNIINTLRLYVLFSFLYYLFIILYSKFGWNKTESDVKENMDSIDKVVTANRICNLYNILIKNDYISPIEKLKKYVENNSSEDKNKLLFTYILSTDISFYHDNLKMSMYQDKEIDTDNDTNICEKSSNCFFISLSNFKKNLIFPKFEDILDRERILEIIESNDDEVKETYEKIRHEINTYSSNITKNKDYNTIFYKFNLIFASIPAIILSLIAIIFFVFFEWTFLNIYKNDYYNDIDDYLNDESITFIISIIYSIIVFTIAIIINL